MADQPKYVWFVLIFFVILFAESPRSQEPQQPQASSWWSGFLDTVKASVRGLWLFV